MLTVKSLKELRTFGVGPVILIQRAGGFYKARYAGRANFVFGVTPEEARKRLLYSPKSWVSKRNAVFHKRAFAHGFHKVKG